MFFAQDRVYFKFKYETFGLISFAVGKLPQLQLQPVESDAFLFQPQAGADTVVAQLVVEVAFFSCEQGQVGGDRLAAIIMLGPKRPGFRQR